MYNTKQKIVESKLFTLLIVIIWYYDYLLLIFCHYHVIMCSIPERVCTRSYVQLKFLQSLHSLGTQVIRIYLIIIILITNNTTSLHVNIPNYLRKPKQQFRASENYLGRKQQQQFWKLTLLLIHDINTWLVALRWRRRWSSSLN